MFTADAGNTEKVRRSLCKGVGFGYRNQAEMKCKMFFQPMIRAFKDK